MDLCAEAITLLLKFADDTKGIPVPVQEISNYDDRDNLQQALDNMVKWAETWGMKCKIMHGYEYKMAGTRLAEVEEEKDIGVTVQKNMKPSKQCKNGPEQF